MDARRLQSPNRHVLYSIIHYVLQTACTFILEQCMHGGTLYLICIETVVKEANVLLKRSSKMQLIKLKL